MLPDHLNPRLWLRDWLNKPSRAEHVASKNLKSAHEGDAARTAAAIAAEAIDRARAEA